MEGIPQMIPWLKRPSWHSLLLLAALVLGISATGRAQSWADPATLTWASPATETWQDPLTCVWTAPNLLGWGTVTPHAAILTWTASTSPGVTYNVYGSQMSGGPYVLLASGLISTSWNDSPLSSGRTIYFVVTAFDPVGMLESAFSNEVQAIIP